jgi:hypothetical protein
MVQNRGDAMTIIDVVGYNSNITPVATSANTFDTSYAATYWPWLKTIDPNYISTGMDPCINLDSWSL